MKNVIVFLLFIICNSIVGQQYQLLEQRRRSLIDNVVTPPPTGDPIVLTYNWVTATDKNDQWIFVSPIPPDGLAATSTNQLWSWDNNDTPTAGVGPQFGQEGNASTPEGYIYTEGSGLTLPATFTLELLQNIDASLYNINVNFWTNQRGDTNEVTCVLQSNENGAGWINRGTTFGGASDKVGTSQPSVWQQRNVDFTGLISSANTKIRFLIQTPSVGTNFHMDYGLDTFTITMTPK